MNELSIFVYSTLHSKWKLISVSMNIVWFNLVDIYIMDLGFGLIRLL